MRKVLGAVVVVVVAAGLVAPRFVGIKAESQLQDYAANLEHRVGMKAELKDYQRGWFSSSATLILTDKDNAKDVYTSKLTIKHGPVILNGYRPSLAWGKAHYVVAIPADLQQKFDKYFANSKEKPKMDGDIVLTLSDNIRFNFDLPAGNYKDASDSASSKFDWKALKSDYTFKVKDNKYAALSGNVNFDGMVISSANEAQPTTINVSPITVDFDFTQYKKGSNLWTGNSSFNIDAINIASTPNHNFDMTGLMTKFSADIKDKFMNETLTFKLDKFNSSGVKAGPIDMTLSFNKIDAEALDQYISMMHKADDHPSMDDIQKAFLPVVKGGIEVVLDKFDLNLEGKSLKAQGKFVLPASPELKNLMADGPGLLKKISLDATIDAPVDSIHGFLVSVISQSLSTQLNSQAPDAAAPAKMTDAQIADQAKALVEQRLSLLVQMGVVVKKDNNYSIHAVLKDGIFKLNDKQFADLTTMRPDPNSVKPAPAGAVQ